MNDFDESDQTLIFGIVQAMHKNFIKAQNSEYEKMVQGAIDRIAAGGGTVRDIIEVCDND
jgi:hypothetical protein